MSPKRPCWRSNLGLVTVFCAPILSSSGELASSATASAVAGAFPSAGEVEAVGDIFASSFALRRAASQSQSLSLVEGTDALPASQLAAGFAARRSSVSGALPSACLVAGSQGYFQQQPFASSLSAAARAGAYGAPAVPRCWTHAKSTGIASPH